jgi:hypothetical protein
MKWCVQSQVGQAGGWSAKAYDGARWMFEPLNEYL